MFFRRIKSLLWDHIGETQIPIVNFNFRIDPDHDPEFMTSFPVLGFSVIAGELLVVETSS